MTQRTDHPALEALAGAVPLAVVLVDTDEDGARLRFSNQLARERFGDGAVAGGDLEGAFPAGSVHGDPAAAVRAAALAEGPTAFRLSRADGEYPGVAGAAVSVHHLDQRLVALLCESTGTDWQRSEFHAVVDSALDAILTKSLDGTILSWNASASRLYGYSEAEVIGRPVTMLLPPDRKNEVTEIIERLKQGERIREFETSRVCKDGRIVQVSLTITPVRGLGGMVVGAATIARDLTERNLIESRTRLAAIVDASFDPVFSADREGMILTWNAAAERLFGYPAGEIVGQSVAVLLRGDLPPQLAVGLAAEPESAVEPFDLTMWGREGTRFQVSASSSPILGDDGHPIASAVVLRDMTVQRRLEERLRQKQKMEAIGSLASGVAHDFNNVLSVIRGASGLLSQLIADRSTLQLVEEIDRAAIHASELTSQLLAFGRQQLLQPEPTDINREIVPTLEMVRKLLSARVTVVQELAGNLPRIQVDRNQLAQVIINLGANAGEAMLDGGTLTIRTRLAHVAADPRDPDAQQPQTYVVLEVSDSGVGMDAETREHIFDPFYTTKDSGTGLGLATVHGIVEQSGGHVAVRTEPGRGTTFEVQFPLAPGQELGGHPAHTSAVPRGGQETVLVADDSGPLRFVVERLLTAAGYRVITGGDGIEALAAAREHDGPIDLLLSDVVMPRMGGRELYEQLRVLHPEARVVFTSGYAADDVLRHGIATREFDYIQKPASNDAILAQVRATLDHVA